MASQREPTIVLQPAGRALIHSDGPAPPTVALPRPTEQARPKSADTVVRRPPELPGPRGAGPHWIDMRSLAQSLADEVTDRANGMKVSVSVNQCAAPAVVIGYLAWLGEAMRQLIVNAIDAMPQGGSLILRVVREPYVTVECCDTGPERAATSTAAVKPTIEAHRGKVWYRRHPGGGSCVIVELPAAGPRSSRPHRVLSFDDPSAAPARSASRAK